MAKARTHAIAPPCDWLDRFCVKRHCIAQTHYRILSDSHKIIVAHLLWGMVVVHLHTGNCVVVFFYATIYSIGYLDMQGMPMNTDIKTQIIQELPGLLENDPSVRQSVWRLITPYFAPRQEMWGIFIERCSSIKNTASKRLPVRS